jgi:exopolysaccharide biosynthesis protein
MSRLLAGILVLLIGGRCVAETTTTRPLPGVMLERVVWADPPMRFYVVTVDLSNPRIHLKVSRGGSDPGMTPPWQVTLMPVSEIAKRDGLSVAVNGNLFQGKDVEWVMGHKLPYFAGNWAKVSGWAMSDGVAYSRGPMAPGYPSLIVTKNGEVRFGSFTELPADAEQVVSGTGQIVANGQVNVLPDGPAAADATTAAHTAAGVDRDGKKLILFVVDGRQPGYSAGMQQHRIAEVLVARGVWNAVILDGGGSATLVMRGADGSMNVINRPSDGHDLPVGMSIERSVANALGVVIDPAVIDPPAAATQPSQP